MPELAWDIGYSDQACWVMYERRPDGSILVLDTGEVEETMSDFKVGDVVRCNQARCPCDHKDETVTEVYPWGLKVSDGSMCQPQYISLVSRPSEAKPQPPALKVGDRVHCKLAPGLGAGTIRTILESSARVHWDIDGASDRLDTWPQLSTLELLPPEPARKGLTNAAIAAAERVIRGADLAGRYRQEIMGHWPCGKPGCEQCDAIRLAKPPRPMTATEASIRARNSYEPLLPTADQMEYLRNKMMRDIIGSMALSKEMLEGHAHRAPVPDNQGWMPAGTYMPLKEEPRPKSIAAGMTPQQQLDYMMGCAPGDCLCMERGPGIVKTISHHERRFPSRTLSWTNLGDEYDLLPDAY